MTAIRMRSTAAVTCSMVAFALGACGTDDDAGSSARPATTDVPGSIRAGETVPVPTGRPVLRVTGVREGNAGGTTVMDLATIDRLPRVEVSIDEPFQERTMTFSGVRMTDLLRIAGAPPGATRVAMHALDDYQVAFRRKDLTDTGAVLATRADGRRIRLEDGGPIRVVFPIAEGPARNDDNWIWSVDRIRVAP